MKHILKIIFCIYIIFIIKIQVHALPNANIQSELQKNIEKLSEKNTIFANQPILHVKWIKEFYSKRKYFPVWSFGMYVPQRTQNTIECLSQSLNFGIPIENIHLSTLQNMQTYLSNLPINNYTDSLIKLDILLTDALLQVAYNYSNSIVKANEIDTTWFGNYRKYDVLKFISEAVKSEDICYALSMLQPVYKEYFALQGAMQKYAGLQWDSLPNSASLLYQKGDHDPFIIDIKKRLIAEQLLDNTTPINDEFDESLRKAVVQFQKNNGLEPEGLVRSRTISIMNIPAKKRREQIIANLERWRWLPNNLGKNYIFINIPEFKLRHFKNYQATYIETIVVGNHQNPSPSFVDTITHLILNPKWFIPKSIVEKEVLPKLKEDKNYFNNSNILVMHKGKAVDATKINWDKVKLNDYSFAQNINENNPMGNIKFVFRNKYNVYMHDTPAKELFDYTFRSHSHGCIRLDNAINFAAHILKPEQPQWDTTQLRNTLKIQKETKIELKEHLPIYLLYESCWVDTDNNVCFREDIYNWDTKLSQKIQSLK